MADMSPRPEDRRTSSTNSTNMSRPLADRTAGSTGTTVAAVLLVIGLVLLGIMFLTPSRNTAVNSTTPNTGTSSSTTAPPSTTTSPSATGTGTGTTGTGTTK